MMVIEVLADPPSSVILVTDPAIGEVPGAMHGLPASTSTCVAVATMTSADGATRIRLNSGDGSTSATVENLALIWEGRITTSARLAVATVLWDELASVPTRGEVDLQIWADNPDEPGEILILVRPAN
jgi:hypothetical protein